MKNRKLLLIICGVVAVISGIIAYVVLPEIVAVQWNFEGVSNTMTKLGAVLSGIGVSALGIVISAMNTEKRKQIAGFLVGVLGIVMQFVFILTN